ncbi:MAG: hypothetical protein M3220_03430 [Chloroflexota bacterium]|nr:hypothetical protein [Chloroflexota bacterium]
MRITNVEFQSITVELSPQDAEALALALDTAAVSALGLVPNWAEMGLPDEGSPEAGEVATKWRAHQSALEAVALAAARE